MLIGSKHAPKFITRKKQTIHFELKKVINQPVESVFLFIADAGNMIKWDIKIHEIKEISEGGQGEGARYWMIREIPQGITENIIEITEYQVNRALTFKIISGLNPYVYQYKFEPIGEGQTNEKGTLLSLKADAEVKGFTNFIEAVVEVEQNLEKIKTILEEKA